MLFAGGATFAYKRKQTRAFKARSTPDQRAAPWLICLVAVLHLATVVSLLAICRVPTRVAASRAGAVLLVLAHPGLCPGPHPDAV